MSIVRENMLTRLGYVPYCGRDGCMRRAAFNGRQMACQCGWVSEFPADFIEQYKAAQERLATTPKDRHEQ